MLGEALPSPSLRLESYHGLAIFKEHLGSICLKSEIVSAQFTLPNVVTFRPIVPSFLVKCKFRLHSCFGSLFRFQGRCKSELLRKCQQ